MKPDGRFAKKLILFRKDRGMTQVQLAKATGLRQDWISHFECGRRIPTISNLVKICRALDVSADCLIGTFGRTRIS